MHTAVSSRRAFAEWLPFVLGIAWSVASVAGWVFARQAGWTAGELVLAGSVWFLVLLGVSWQLARELFGPVLTYEVVRAGRKTSTFVLRWSYIGLVVGLLALVYFSWSEGIARRGGRGLIAPTELARFANTYFEVIAVVQILVIALLTPGYVAGTITGEKERQTLEFLLATDLRNREIIFGKLAARTLVLVTYVLAGLPVLAFLQLFGGIDPDLALASSAGAVITVVGLSAVSLALSAALKKSRDAIAITYLLLVLYLAGSFALAAWIRFSLTRANAHLSDFGLFVIDWQEVADSFAAGNPIYVYPIETRGGTVVLPDVVARMLGRYAAFWGIVTILSLLYATLRVRAVALNQAFGVPRLVAAKAVAERPDIGTQPVLWREVFGGKMRVGGGGWFFRFVIVALVAILPAFGVYECFINTQTRQFRPSFAARWEDFTHGMSIWVRITTGVLTTVVLFAAALRGASAIAGERDKDSWISLISTPLTPQEILIGKWVGCVLGMRFAFWVLLGVWAVGLGLEVIHPLMMLATILLLAIYVSAFSWVGILCSLWAKTSLGASIRAFGLTVFFAGGFWLLFLVCCALPVSIMDFGGSTLKTPAVFLMAATPPFMAGWAPMTDFDRDGLGPFDPHNIDNEFGPIAPVVGAVFWVLFSLAMAPICLQLLTKQMNRDDKSPREPPRHRAARAE